ncbi:phosphotransferase [Aquimonas voraii]|uniref:Predicted 3-hydroxylacyl-ACP dehydratase, HotDog domain n=1 Tax=Aquimonas voraii TaxID=265719 RepID=A0A1G7A269_9GAMM|nr:phosphotransferase [Aquimonas voraii]SDE08860.1 Predicted 3-hydroxylacyl-ACP dehydratase, HotDog domain [Aquimonas voraii]
MKLPDSRFEIEQLIPHAGGMCLLERVIAFDESGLHAQSDAHRDPAHPLRREGRLSALHLCEYGAQAMAVHGGLLAARDGRTAPPGLLVSLRGVELSREFIDELPGPLDVYAQDVADSGAGWQCGFRIEHAGEVLATGRAAVLRRDS